MKLEVFTIAGVLLITSVAWSKVVLGPLQEPVRALDPQQLTWDTSTVEKLERFGFKPDQNCLQIVDYFSSSGEMETHYEIFGQSCPSPTALLTDPVVSMEKSGSQLYENIDIYADIKETTLVASTKLVDGHLTIADLCLDSYARDCTLQINDQGAIDQVTLTQDAEPVYPVNPGP